MRLHSGARGGRKLRGYRRFLLVAAAAVAGGALASGVLAPSGHSSAGARVAASPCAGLPGVYGTACQKDLQACQALPASQARIKNLCLTEIDSGFHALFQALHACGSLPAASRATCQAAEKQALAALQAQAAQATKSAGGGTGGGGGGGGGSTTTTTTTTTTSGSPPPPVSGRSADAAPVAGTVLVNGAPLTAGKSIPVGATVDATNGTVTLTSVSPTGAIQSAQFHSGVFQLKQARNGVTDLVLEGGDFGACSTKGPRRLAAAPSSTAVVRQLWGNGKGSFETDGRYAAATVRGTLWDTQDRCDGTRIVVQRGIVSVLDRVRHATVTVTAGHSYLAKR